MTQELKNKVEQIIEYCRVQSDIYNNYQLGSKVVINGIYGSFGFSGFYFYNKDIAEAVTKQGKNVILYAEDLVNKWAQKVWQKDKKTHKQMGIKLMDERPIDKGVTVYIDTDSLVGDSIINIEDTVISIETESGKLYYNENDIIKVCRDGVEMEIKVSDIQKNDLINV